MKVKKDLSPEEQTLIANIEALVGQLKQMEAGDAEEGKMAEAEMARKAAEEESKKGKTPEELKAEEAKKAAEEEEKKRLGDQAPNTAEEITKAIMKAIETTNSDASTASSTAEEIEDDQPKQNTEAIAEVVKALLAAAKPVRKSKPVDPMTAAVNSLITAMKSQNDKIATIEKSLVGMLEGMGIAEQVTSALDVAKSQVAPAGRPLTNPDMTDLVNFLKGQTAQKSVEAPLERNQVRKELGEAMMNVFGSSNLIRK